ncbi:taste receptor type 2 member 7-like [Phyllobates terribilis]|uniref:taste receptor type 2 member 7-like n=1 Tax=Phyllobates terribilis TaxID=111132 RepID=UPI003CCA7395
MTQFMLISVLVVEFLSLLITFPGHIFILVVNILDWMKNKRLDISDQLINGMSLCNILHRIYQLIIHSIIIIKKDLLVVNLKILVHLLYLFPVLCTLLFSTWLAIHFCLKIVNINHKLYVYVQFWFPKMFPWIFLSSFFASVFISVPAALGLVETNLPNSTDTLMIPKRSLPKLLHYHIPSAVNIILSLRRHVKRIHESSGEFRPGIVEAHFDYINPRKQQITEKAAFCLS